MIGLGDGEIRLTAHEAIGEGPFFEHVRGTMKRTDAEPRDVEIADARFAPEVTEHAKARMARLAGVAGRYAMEGWFEPAPGAPNIEFTGGESMTPIFGGTVLEAVIEIVPTGSPDERMPTVESVAWVAWDDPDGCYAAILAADTGEVGTQEWRWCDGKIVVTTAGLRGGRPGCTHDVLELDEHGGYRSYTGYALSGTLPPSQVFWATFRRM